MFLCLFLFALLFRFSLFLGDEADDLLEGHQVLVAFLGAVVLQDGFRCLPDGGHRGAHERFLQDRNAELLFSIRSCMYYGIF